MAVRRCKRISRIAWACSSVRRYRSPLKPKSSLRDSGRQASLPTRSNNSNNAGACQRLSINACRASAAEGEFLISSITASMLANATAWPSKIWPRWRARRNRYSVRRVTTSSRCCKKACSISCKFSSLGWPSTNATQLIPNTACNWVWLYRLLRTTSPDSPRRSSITTRKPSLSDSSRSSVMPSMRFSFTNSAIFSISRALFS